MDSTLSPPDKPFTVSLLYVSMWRLFCTQRTGQGLVSGLGFSHRHGLTSVCGWKLQPCFKPLQAEAAQGQFDCIGTRKLLPDVKEELIMEV